MDDAGGGYSESIASMIEELHDQRVPLLCPLPESDECVFNASLQDELAQLQFRFLGVLMGIAIRTASPIALRLSTAVRDENYCMSRDVRRCGRF